MPDPSLTSLTPAETIATLNAAVLDGDLERALTYLDPDVEVIEAASLPYGGVHRGRDDFRALMEHIGSLADMELPNVNLDQIDETTVLVRIQLALTSHATGKKHVIDIAEIDTVVNGLIKKMDVFYKDTALLNEFYAER
jgi:hypothetical protein